MHMQATLSRLVGNDQLDVNGTYEACEGKIVTLSMHGIPQDLHEGAAAAPEGLLIR